MTYPIKEGVKGLVPALEHICTDAAQAVSDGYTFIVLSDKRAGREFVPIRCVIGMVLIY